MTPVRSSKLSSDGLSVSDLSQCHASLSRKYLSDGLAIFGLCVSEHLITRWTISYLQIAICLKSFVMPAVR